MLLRLMTETNLPKGERKQYTRQEKNGTKNSLVTPHSFTFSHWPVGDAEMTLSIQKKDHFVNKHRSNIKSSPQHTSRTKLLTLRCRLYSDRGSYNWNYTRIFKFFFLPPITNSYTSLLPVNNSRTTLGAGLSNVTGEKIVER